MDVPDLRNVDFEAYRRQAAAMRAQAIDAAIDRALARLRSLIGLRPAITAKPTRTPSAHCPA